MALFEEASNSEVTIDQLVGDGKKYKTVDELAKAYSHASTAIQDRERELAGLREELNTRLSVEDQLKQFQEANTTRTPENPPERQPARQSNGEEPDLAKRVREVIEQERRETSARSNQQEVERKLIEVFGSAEKAGQVIRAKAAELGVSTQFLESIAVQSPLAFYNQIGLTETPRNQSPINTPSRGSVNTEALGLNAREPAVGTYEYFEAIRKNNPAQYWDPKTQSRIHKAAQEGTYQVPDPVYDV